jgi:enolase
MSILQEYQEIRKDIGEDIYNAINTYLNEVTTKENYNKYYYEFSHATCPVNELRDYELQLKEKYNIVLLDDIYYTKEGWDKFEKWYKKGGIK